MPAQIAAALSLRFTFTQLPLDLLHSRGRFEPTPYKRMLGVVRLRECTTNINLDSYAEVIDIIEPITSRLTHTVST